MFYLRTEREQSVSHIDHLSNTITGMESKTYKLGMPTNEEKIPSRPDEFPCGPHYDTTVYCLLVNVVAGVV